MLMRLPIRCLFILFISVNFSLLSQKIIEQNDRLHFLHKSMDVKSSIIIYNQQKNTLITNDTLAFKETYSPNSTFFLYESLIGLESGTIKDSLDKFLWNSFCHPNENWNQDQTLFLALKHKTEWYFEQVAIAVDSSKMQSWLNLIGYGNKDISGGINQFWQSSSLKISVKQQFDLFKRLYYYNLPFSFENLKFIRKAFNVKRLVNKNLYSFKTNGMNQDKQLIWYMGYVEFLNNTYLIVHCVESNSRKKNNYINTIQSELLFSTLKELGIVDDGMCDKL
jgi:beta-lactamase class D